MNKGNNILICIGLLLMLYMLFSGAIIEGISSYIKGSSGTLCDKGKHIASKSECGEALKSLELSTKEWWTGNNKEMPPFCSVSTDSEKQQAQWNESEVGKGHDGSFPICKGEGSAAMTPEEADAALSTKARKYLQGISDELKQLGKLRNKKRRTPVNIHIDVGDSPGQEGTPRIGKTRPSLGSADFPTQDGEQDGGQDGGQKAETCKFELPNNDLEILEHFTQLALQDFEKEAGRRPTEEEGMKLDEVVKQRTMLALCTMIEKEKRQDANCIPPDLVDRKGIKPIAEFYKNTCSQSQKQSYESAEFVLPSANKNKLEGFGGGASLFPPTMGKMHYGFTEGFLEGIGEPKNNDYGLKNQSKDNSDIRNVSEYKRENARHQHSPNDQHEQRSQPVSQETMDNAFLKNNSLNKYQCTEKDHRGCRWWAIDSEADKERKKREMEAKQYNAQLESNYKLELENWKLEEKAKKEGYDKEKAIWDEQQKKLKEEKEEKQEAEKQRREEARQEIAIKQQMVKDNNKFDRIEQMNKLAWKELSKPDDPNDPTTLAGKANTRYEKDLLNWWEAEQIAHARGEATDPNIKPPTMAGLTAHTSDKVASLLADFQSVDWGGAAGTARNTKPPNKLPQNYKPSRIALVGDRHGKTASPIKPHAKSPLKPPPKAPAGPPAEAGQAPKPLIGESPYAEKPPEGRSRQSRQAVGGSVRPVTTSRPAKAGQAPPPLKQAEGTTQVDNTGFFRGWTGDGSKTGSSGGGSGGNPSSRYGIKKIIYDKEKKISPKTQRELGLGVHDMKDSHKQVIKQANEPQTWYEWAFGGGKARPDHSHTHI